MKAYILFYSLHIGVFRGGGVGFPDFQKGKKGKRKKETMEKEWKILALKKIKSFHNIIILLLIWGGGQGI